MPNYVNLGITVGSRSTAAWYPSRLFNTGDILLWYDPSDLTTMFQDTTGTTPVTADGQSVALQLDKGQWGGKTLPQMLAVATEIIPTQDLGAADWVGGGAFGNWASSSASGSVITTLGTNGARRFRFAISSGETIVFSGVRTTIAGTPTLNIAFGTAAAALISSVSVTGNQVIATAPATSAFAEVIVRVIGASGSQGQFTNLTAKRVPGYHRSQATGTSQKKYKTDGTLHWLLYDGFDDGDVTQSINWGTNEVAFCAGVTKASDAASGIFFEASATISSNNGAVYLANSGGSANWSINSKGTVQAAAVGSTGSAPNTAVVTGQSKISTDYLNLRGNGAQIASSATDQGTGNFGNHVWYFGRRGGATLPVNGSERQIVIRNRLFSAAELSKLETYVAAKTGVTL